MPFKDDLTHLKLMQQQPSNYMDGVLEEPKVLNLPRIEPSKVDHGLMEVDHSNPPNSDTWLSNGREQIAKKVVKTSPSLAKLRKNLLYFLATFQREWQE